MDNKNTFYYKAGQFIGMVFTGCVVACISACSIALAVRFITWLF